VYPPKTRFAGSRIAPYRSVQRDWKNIAIYALGGALLGVIVASFIVPPALAWYSAPGGLPKGAQIQAIVEIPEVIRYSTSRLLHGQVIGGIMGSGLGLAFGIFLHVRDRRTALS